MAEPDVPESPANQLSKSTFISESSQTVLTKRGKLGKTVKRKHRKRKTRRRSGEGKVNSDSNDSNNVFSVLHNNCRGALSKLNSIETISKSLKVQVITLNEINLQKNRKLKINGFKTFSRNRKEGRMGGVATLVLENEEDETMKVTEGKETNEYVITRHGQFQRPINIINIYGDVESRTTVDNIDTKWNEILDEITKIEAREENVLIIGDLNKHSVKYIRNNRDKETHGGNLIKELVRDGKYILVNSTNKTINSPFTRHSPEDPNNGL